LIRRATKKAMNFRANGRVKGSRNKNPNTSLMKPGTISNRPPTRTSAASASCPVGTLPWLYASLSAVHARAPWCRISQAPSTASSTRMPTVGHGPIS
jgi:hypothetical protein